MKTHMKFASAGITTQRGAITLAISLAILVLSTLVTFNLSKAILMEQKITNNEARAKQAFEVAEAGLMEALTYLQSNPDVDGNGSIDPVFDTDSDGTGDSTSKNIGTGRVTVTTCDLGTVNCASGGDMTTIRITAVGTSDDRSASRTISYTMTVINPLGNAPDNPFITRGSAGFGGSVYIENLEGHSTVWTGGSVSLSGNGGTAVPSVSDPGYPTCMDVPQTCVPADASNSSLVGLDVV
jgi:Tfp pilus assembly protein PilX